MAKKPPFNPNKPFVPATDAAAKPAFNPNKQFERVTDETGHIDDFSAPPAAKKVDNLEPILNEIVRTSVVRISDSEKEMLRDILKNPNTTGEQAKEAIQTLQGYHPKQKNNTITSPEYYIKRAENGVVMPIALGQGERPPKGYNVSNVWGQTKKDAEDDGYLTDLGKSLFNALPALAESVADVGNFVSLAATGEESQFLNRMANYSQSLKLNKNERGGKTLYNPSDAESFGELFSSDRFDLSKESLWNTLNWATESLPQFLLGAGEAKAVLTGGKMAVNAARGVKGAAELGKLGNSSALFASSFAMQIGENMQSAKDAGLEGSDIAKVGGSISTVQALLDAFTGLDIGAKLFNPEIKVAASELLKKFVAEAERDATTGLITKKAMKKLGEEYALEYGKMANSFVKQGLKGTGEEMGQEVLQEITKKAGEQMWDAMSDEDKAKFGTDALSARSFGDYLSAGINSLGVAPVSFLTAEKQKERYKEQSLNAYEIIQGGKDKIDEFKANVYNEFRKGNLTEAERDQAVFKIDAYDKYAKQVADLRNMTDKDKKEAFELSFNIEALKKEIDIPKEDLDKLDPIAIAKIDSKKTLISGLQKELNSILLKQDIQTETKIGEDTVNKVAKDLGVEPKTDKEGNKQPTSLDDVLAKVKSMPAPETKVRAKIDEINPEQWVKKSKNNPMEIKAVVQEHLKDTPNNEMEVTIHSDKNGRYVFMVDEGKPVRFGQSVEGREDSKTPDYFRRENLPATKIEIEDRAGDADPNNQALKEHYFKEKAIVKRVEFEADKNGKRITKAVLPVYNAQTGKFIGFAKESNVGKSSYPTREEKAQLRYIEDANLLDGSLKGYEHKAEERAKVPNFRYRTVEEFVEDYVGGEMKGTPEEQEFYTNNADAIEAALRDLTEGDKAAAEKEIDKKRKDDSIPKKFFQGKRVELQEGMMENEYINAVLRDSENPAQIADAWVMSPVNEKIDGMGIGGAAPVMEGIYNFFKDGGKLTPDAFKKLIDPNFYNYKDTPALNEYVDVENKGIGVSYDSDNIKEYSSRIEPSDIADFITKYPNGAGGYSKSARTSLRYKLSEKFKYLTGRTLTESFAKKLADEEYRRQEFLAQDEGMAAMDADLDAQYKADLENAAERDRVFAETGQFQKESNRKADFQKVFDRIKKVMPKVKVVIDATIVDGQGNPVAGQVQGNTLKINPDYAGADTPIHEAGHILIDAIGYNNRVIQKAISQLKDTDLWKETKERYDNLSEEMLGKEVLAEAIGREGADVFTTQAAKSKFKAILDYLFDKLKTLFGINKNVAKSLAKQIISGIGTKGLRGTDFNDGKKVSFQMPSGEKVDGKEVQVDVVNGFYSNLEKQLLQIKLDKIPAKQWADKLKGEEAKWTGLTDWLNSQTGSVSKKDIQNFLKENRISIVEVDKSKDVKFEQYQLEGEKENYKEVLVTLPSKKGKITDASKKMVAFRSEMDVKYGEGARRKMSESETKKLNELIELAREEGAFKEKDKFNSSHFEEPNILVHLRMNTRTDADGNKVLFLEEVQSDWGQKGKKEGFAENIETITKDNSTIEKVNNNGSDFAYKLNYKGKDLAFVFKDEQSFFKNDAEINNVLLHRANRDYARSQENKIPTAPFVTDTNSWTKLGLKVALKEAVKQGADKIAWTTGEQQNDRYDLSKSVNRVTSRSGKDVKYVDIDAKSGSISLEVGSNGKVLESQSDESFGQDSFVGTNLSDVIGKEVADKIMSSDKVDLSGDGLKVGGKGMKGFYGSPTEGSLGIVGNVAKKLFNQEPKTVILGQVKTLSERAEIEENRKGLFNIYDRKTSPIPIFKDIVTREEAERLLNNPIKNQTTQQSIDITPELVKQVGGGLPMFQKPKGKKELSPEDAKAKEIMDDIGERGMSEIPYEELVEIYNAISTSDISMKTDYQAKLERRIGLNLKERGLQNSQKEVSEGTLKFKDIGWFDKWFKVLSWFDEKFPEMKELSKMWNTAFFNKMKEARSEKNTHDKLAEAVVKERNNKLGIVEKGKSLLSNRAYKSFEYLDNGKGQLITLDEAKAKGLSDAQIKYLKYVRDLIAKRQEIGADGDVYNTEMDVIKLDKGFSEAFQSDGFVAAVGSFFGNNNDLLATEITFTNPNTGREQRARFADVQTILTKYGEKGLKEKAKATMLMVKYGREAKYELKNRIVEEGLNKATADRIIVDEKGNLLSRFGGERIQGRAYSKDFYNAVTQYIDDSAHIKHISPLVPIINSIELLAKKGAIVDGEILAKKKANLSQWMDMWIKQHVLRKPDENDPTLDASIKALRFATSGIAMWFNAAANLMNVAIGNYMNFWKEGGATWWKGNKRLFGNLKYSAAILNKYVAVSNDIDSNPFVGVKNKLAALGYIGQKYGEWQIQGSGLLGLMSDEDYNSFEFKKNQYGVEELVIKDMPEAKKKALEDRILALMDRVSDVQGKYSPKDRMNIMNNEFGKIAMQFKVWIPAWVHSRFGDEGSYKIAYRNFLKDGLKELRTDLKSKGFIKTYKTNKAFAQNLRGALTIGFLMSLAYQDDDDKEKSAASEFAQKALHDVLFIFDPENLKYTLTHPVAITGTIEKFINAFEHLIYLEEYKGDSKYGDKGDLKIQGDILSATPAGNVMEIVDSVTEEE